MPKDAARPDIPEEFLKPYDAATEEPAMIKRWEDSGLANPDTCVEQGFTSADAEPFTIVLPPPNVTGTLHMGHAAMVAVEDILVRYARMNGKRTLWIPGTDSAAIATQSKVESEIYKKEKLTRYDLGRDELMRRIELFTDESKSTIINQVRSLGASLDWSRYAYTMDEPRYNAVMTAFVRMYEAGLIYRGDRIVNWDPNLQTTVSDDEIEYVEKKDPFYYFQYGPFVIGTVRPETKFGDKYVVMHPDDERYAAYTHRQEIDLEWINGPIRATVIKDSAVDMQAGSGVMTITPAHSGIDFEIAERHGLDKERVIDDRGILLPIAGEFAGTHIKKARAAIVEKLQKKGLVVKIDEAYVHNVATNSRGGGTIEPQIKKQWFIGVNKKFVIPHSQIDGIASGSTTTLKKLMKHVVESKQIAITPERFERVYYNWIDNLRDWCISRQIWFGHRIPVWYRAHPSGDTVDIHCSVEGPMDDGWERDPDTLDTWFSSGLWTISTLGWPEETLDFTRFHPTSVLETGYDILFFWVARMILMTGFCAGQVPFRNVYLHGLVRDGQGRKMSKSLGNIIDPLDMIAKYGADATRLSLIIGAQPGNDLKLSEDRVRGYKHFANKLWNVSRFVLENVTQDTHGTVLSPEDEALITEARSVVAEVTANMQQFRLDLAADQLYHFVWDRFAAEILEGSKPLLKGEDLAARQSRAKALYEVLSISLRALHPFMPFVTEAIWQRLPQKDRDLIMVSAWPA